MSLTLFCLVLLCCVQLSFFPDLPPNVTLSEEIMFFVEE